MENTLILINFGMHFSSLQISQVEAVTGGIVQRVIDYQVDIDPDLEVFPQFKKRMEKFPLNASELHDEQIIVNLPGQNYLCVLLVAFLHQKMGRYPGILRTRLRTMGIMPYHEVSEMLDLNV